MDTWNNYLLQVINMEKTNINFNKKWLLWVNGSQSPIEVWFFRKANDELHYHDKVYEYYLVKSWNWKLLVDWQEIDLKEWDIICINPWEKHKIYYTDGLFECFLLKFPHIQNDKIICKE